MSLPNSGVQNILTAHKESDGLEELENIQISDSSVSSESDPPDGGFRAWVTVFGCFLMQFCGFGYIASFGVYQDYYTRIYMPNYPPSAISWVGALATFLADGITLISGPLYDKGWFYHMMIVGSTLQSFSLFMLSVAKPNQFYLVFMMQGALSGFATGLTYAPSIALVSHHFSKRRTLVMSLVASGAPLGAIVHPIMLNHLLNGPVGFSKGVLASASFVSALLLIACLSARTRAVSAPSGAKYRDVARKCSHEVLFIFMTAGATLFLIGFNFPLFYLQLDSVKHGIDINFSFYSIVIMNAGAFIGRSTAGIIASYVGVLNMTVVSTIACSALILFMMALNNITNAAVFAILYGFFSGVYVSLMIPLVAVLTPNLSELGARMGISLAFAAFGGLLGGPISGALLSSQYRWLTPTLFSGLIALTGSLAFVAMRLILYWREKRKTRVM